MALLPYVLLTTTDASGGNVTVTAFRQPRIHPPPATDYPPPATVSPRQWTPALDESSIAPLVERVVDGRVTKAIAPTADVTFRLMSYLVDGVQTWPIAAGRIWHGQPCEVGYTGVDGSGNTWTMDAPLIIASGEAASSTDDRPWSLEITVRSHPDLWATSVPARTWLGYQGGVLCDGATASGPTGYATVPTAFTWQALILLPLAWDYGGAGRAPLVTHASCRWYADALVDGHSWSFSFEYWTGATFQTLTGILYTGDERFHWIDLTVDLAAAGGGVSATFGVDGAETTATNATAFSAAAGSWLLFDQSPYFLATIIGAIAFFNVAKTRAELDDLQSSRLIGDETGLTLYYPGPLTATKLLDNTLANYGSPYDVTVTGGVHRTLLEGAAPLAGTRPTLIYRGLQMPPTPVDVANRVYSFGQDVELIESANARGADWPITWYDNIRACLAAAPAAGTVAACSFGGIMKIGSGDALELAADVRGVGGNDDAPWSLALGSNYGSGKVSFASWNALMAGLTAWTLDIRFSTIVDPTVNYQAVFNSGFVNVWVFSAVATGIRPLLYTDLQLTSGGSMALFADFPVDTTVDYRLEAWNSGGDAFMRITVNGSLATLEGGTSGYATTVTDTIKTAGLVGSPTLSAGVGNESIYLGVLPMRFWDTATTGTDAAATAAAEASCRKFLFRDPVNGTDAEYANLVSLWHGPLGGTPATVEDLIGTNDGAITGTPHWRPPLAFDNPVPAAVYTLETLGSYALSSIDISDSAYSTYGAQTLWVEGGAKTEDSGFKSVAEVLDMAMGAGYALLHGNGTVTLGAVVAATAGNAVGTITADEVYEISPRRLQPSGSPGFAGPPSVIEYTYGRSGLVSDPLATAPEDIAAQISRDVGRDQVPVSSWGLYGDAGKERTLVLPGTYLLRTRAKAAADDAATTWAPLRPVMVVKLKSQYLTAYDAGDIVGVWDYRAGATIYVMILQATRRQRQAGVPGDEWEVA